MRGKTSLMPPRTIQYSFAHGECSEEFLGGRSDLQRYYASCRVLENYLPLLTGGVTRAPGTRLMGTPKGESRVRLQGFEFSIEQAYMLEFGERYVRIYKDDGRLEHPPGTPVEVSTPYRAQDLFTLQFVQSADVLYIVHPAFPVQTLLRLSELDWVLQPLTLRPEPVIDEDFAPPATLTPSATSGFPVTLTASAPVFLASDVDRQVRGHLGWATITSLQDPLPTAVAFARVTRPFVSTAPLPAGSWWLVGSPVADCTPSRTTPIGAQTTLTLSSSTVTGPNLLTMGAWEDLSGGIVVAGTATGGSQTTLIDTNTDFFTSGVQAGHRVLRTAGGEGRADTTGQTTNPGDTVTMNPGLPLGVLFGNGEAYTIRRSGVMTVSAGQLVLNPGANGIAIAEQDVPVAFGQIYELEFTVEGQSITALVGSVSGSDDLLAEASFAPGTHAVQFRAAGADVQVQFRNSQSPVSARVGNIRLHLSSVAGWRVSDVGSYVQLFGGTVELTEILDSSRAQGIIWWPLKPDELKGAPIPTALAGAWALMRPAWTAARGYPRTVSFYQGRLAFARDLSLWLSATGLYDNFALGTDDDQAVFLTISANKMNVIEWLEPLRDLMIGTRGTEHMVRGGERGITPSSFEQVPLPTENGSQALRPAKMGTMLYQLGRGGRNIYEVRLDPEQNRITDVRDLLVAARPITTSGIVQWAVENEPVKRLWMVRGDGQAVCFTVDLAEDVRGFARRTTQGVIESLATIPIDAPGGASEITEAVWLVVNRATGRCIERMEPGLTLDSALTYTGPAVSTVTGLAHLEGQVVGVLNNGAYETQVVKDGAVTLDRPGTAVTVGLEYVCTLGLPRPELVVQDGTLQTLRKHIVQASVRLKETMGLQVNGEVVPFRRTTHRMDGAAPAQDLDIAQHLRGWSQDGAITLTQTLPFPSTILSVVLEMEYEETT